MTAMAQFSKGKCKAFGKAILSGLSSKLIKERLSFVILGSPLK
jgi:hypothetical protein